jgi:excisionase family DNA binding protein
MKRYTTGQVAKLLDVPDRTIRRYVQNGKIEGSQNPITKTWSIGREAIIGFARQKVGDDFAYKVVELLNEPEEGGLCTLCGCIGCGRDESKY